jgi:N-acetylneuraminic acid mutarotase
MNMYKSTFIILLLMVQTVTAWAHSDVKIDWQTQTPLPEAVGGHMSAWCDGELFVIGGTAWKDGVKSTLSDVWAYSQQRKTWRCAPSLPRPIAYGVAESTFNGIEIDGGWDHDQALKDVYFFSPKSNQWQRKNNLPLPLAYAGGGMIQGRNFLIGGAADLAKDESYNSVLWQNDAGQWRNISQIPAPRALSATAFNQKGLYIFGGMKMQKGQVQNLADAWFYDVKKKRWKTLRPLPIAARGMAACAISEKYFLLAGGFSDHYLNQVLLYDVKKDIYTPLTPLPCAVMGFQMVYADGAVYVTGGEDAPRHRSNLFFAGQIKYDNNPKSLTSHP